MEDEEVSEPGLYVIAVPIEKIVPNTYNPNAVAPPEMKLLYESIKIDGYTMPIVCYHDKEQDQYIIVDGFHRYRIMLDHPDIYEREGGMLPVSVIDKPIGDYRMASTIRHNRAPRLPQRGPDEQHRKGAARHRPLRRLDRQAPGHGEG